eukprot:CAMPEP_0117058706 /NCGR_PEP_ID=MMETSP0472-20121206/40783_1 /TAXON_ID=693140 ORGANISM="Tiarina fusus, Strain LIS" /NCGR_SAMPLE_ID=MMETSP0472 /ASSEMBLY_ACC=CAM_ASM_000603 /LENGTH=199 /DNA_ID=CAMNT_0004776137 /DNA_START=138 /DNA_END=736 /DNA_ORIENTATION=+
MSATAVLHPHVTDHIHLAFVIIIPAQTVDHPVHGADASLLAMGDKDCMASNEWYEENTDFYEDETDAYIEDGDNEANNYEAADYEAADGYERDYIDGGSDGLNHAAASANKSFMAYFIIAGVLGVFIMVTVWRKREQLNGGDLSEELHPDGKNIKGAIQSRMTDTEMGRSVSRLDDGATQTTFMSAGADTTGSTGYTMA